MYLMMGTHSDIAFAVLWASPAMDWPTEADWIGVECTLKYLWGMSNYGSLYWAGNSKGVLEAFSNPDLAGDVRTRPSTSGALAVYAGSAIAWSSQLQRSVALSTTEAEFIAPSEGAKKLLWLKCLLGELSGKCSEVPTLYVENTSTVKLMKNPEFHKQWKHIEVWYYFVREC